MYYIADVTDSPAPVDPRALDHIPGENGWPIVGNTLTVLRDPLGTADRMYKKYGPVYRNRVFGYTSVSLKGATRMQRKDGAGWVDMPVKDLAKQEPKPCQDGDND